ncbi:hypothetical protein NO2_1076 [Candidatus Termititenax persephonae]|uniref:Uncharacterized protein n=1 Tax=Candidatus Termititenax persephonae TaxID=2218525 RepID=A0A388TJC1_9BACT|nr:hypothetical protein NO2_1076 [Candidatus Termititenax persephonae]
MNDTLLMNTGMSALIEKLGNVDAEKFISLVLREPFDYTKWRKNNLFVGMSIEDISRAAMKLQ